MSSFIVLNLNEQQPSLVIFANSQPQAILTQKKG